jgi:plasmid stabilization system protein ParE
MRVVYTETALRDLASIYEYQTFNWPTVTARFNMRLAAIERYIGEFPRGAPKLRRRGDVRAIAFGSFPYRLFYKEGVGTIEVLTIRHTSRSLGEDCYRTADALGF